MLFTSRATGSIDPNRLAAAMSRPGIDPRVNLCLAIVKKFNVRKGRGVFVDVELHPSQDEETVRMGATYAGNGFGLYAPLHIDDEVLVGFPDGEPDAGGVILARLWSTADPPPQGAVDNIADVLLQIEPGQAVRIQANDALFEIDANGQIAANPASGQKVVVGATAPTGEAIIHGTTYRSNEDTMLTALAAFMNTAGSDPLMLSLMPAAAAAFTSWATYITSTWLPQAAAANSYNSQNSEVGG